MDGVRLASTQWNTTHCNTSPQSSLKVLNPQMSGIMWLLKTSHEGELECSAHVGNRMLTSPVGEGVLTSPTGLAEPTRSHYSWDKGQGTSAGPPTAQQTFKI